MFLHSSIHLALVHQRQQELLAEAERHRIARAAAAGGQIERSWQLKRAVRELSPTTTTSRPQEAKA